MCCTQQHGLYICTRSMLRHNAHPKPTHLNPSTRQETEALQEVRSREMDRFEHEVHLLDLRMKQTQHQVRTHITAALSVLGVQFCIMCTMLRAHVDIARFACDLFVVHVISGYINCLEHIICLAHTNRVGTHPGCTHDPSAPSLRHHAHLRHLSTQS